MPHAILRPYEAALILPGRDCKLPDSLRKLHGASY